MSATQTWIIGGEIGCDLVIDLPSVSGRHCRLVRQADSTWTVTDLGSTNGTFVNGRRISTETPITRSDRVTLGLLVPMPWPDVPTEPARVLRIGRDSDNDHVIDSPEVSGRHARVVIEPGGKIGIVEDLGSTNGTSVGTPGLRITRSTIRPTDVVYFGPVPVAAASFFTVTDVASPGDLAALIVRGAVMTVGRDPSCDHVIDLPVVSGRHARFFRQSGTVLIEDLGSSNGTYVNEVRINLPTPVVAGDRIGLGSHVLRLVIDPELSQQPIAAVPPERRISTAESVTFPGGYVVAAMFGLAAQQLVLAGLIRAVGTVSVTSALFGLGLATFWVGLTAALFVRLWEAVFLTSTKAHKTPLSHLSRSLLRVGVACGGFSIVLMGLVPVYVGARGGWFAAWLVLGLSVLIGATVGRVIVRVSGRRAVGIPAALGLIVLLGLLCVPLRPLPALGPVGRVAVSVLPTRWAFEALSVLSAGEKADDPATDPVEPFFPAETDRSGPLACVLALAAILGTGVYAEFVMVAISGRAWR